MSTEAPTATALTIVDDKKITTTLAQAGLEPATAQGLLDTFRPLFIQANEICATAEQLHVTDATQVTEIKQARALRLALRTVRTTADKTRKVMKEDSLRRGKAIDGIYNVLEYAVAPVEQRLTEMEEFAERAEAARKLALKTARDEMLKPFGVNNTFYDLANMPEDAFAQFIEAIRLAHEQKIAAEAKAIEGARIAAEKAEADRKAKEAAEAAERERIRVENERLKAEAEAAREAKRIAAEKAAQERAELEAKSKVEREAAIAAAKKAEMERAAIQAAAAEERGKAVEAARIAKEKLDAERKAHEAKIAEERRLTEELLAKERAEAAAVAEAERQARAKIEAELAAAKAAEAAKIKAEQDAARNAALAPEREKLTAFAKSVRALQVPVATTDEGKAITKKISEQVEKFALWIEKETAALSQKN